jgi:hypothetical protein
MGEFSHREVGMKWFPLIVLAAAASLTVSGSPAADRPVEGGVTATMAKMPPVLRPLEPVDNRHLTLPGPKHVVPVIKLLPPVPPVAKASPISNLIFEDYSLRQPVRVPVIRTSVPKPAAPAAVAPPPVVTANAKPSPLGPAAVPAAVKPAAPATQPLADLCQQQIGHWKEKDAREALGAPLRQRPAYDEKKAVNGTIYAFADASNQYKELELDFDKKTGNLRTVFAYPLRLTWQDCRRQWTGSTTAADAAQGRKFYSYTNRRLDVLVDPGGKVISLGWY